MNHAVMEGRAEDMREIMVQAGGLNAGSSLTAQELLRWQQEIVHEYSAAPQPATFTLDATGRAIRGLFDIREADHPMARSTHLVIICSLAASSSRSAASVPVCSDHARAGRTWC
jgi:hypothetical protein